MRKDISTCQDYGVATLGAADGADGSWLANRHRLPGAHVLQKCTQEQKLSSAQSTCA
jgi:hypothetical protein